jgi:hypothetical protein
MKRKTPQAVMLLALGFISLAMVANIIFCSYVLWLYPSWWSRLAVTLSIVGSALAIGSGIRIRRIVRDLDRSLRDLEKDLKL